MAGLITPRVAVVQLCRWGWISHARTHTLITMIPTTPSRVPLSLSMAHLLCITNPLWPGTASYLVSGKPTSQTATGAEFNQRLGVPVSDWTHPAAPTLNCWLKLWTVSVKCHLDWPNDDWNGVIRGLLSARHNIYFIIITTSTGSDYVQRWPLELGWEARHPFQWPCLICDMAESAKKELWVGKNGHHQVTVTVERFHEGEPSFSLYESAFYYSGVLGWGCWCEGAVIRRSIKESIKDYGTLKRYHSTN